MFKVKGGLLGKLTAGFVGVIIFMGIIAGIGWYSARRLVYIERVPRLAHRLDIKMLQCRREEKNIIIRGILPEHIAKWNEAFAEIREIGSEMESVGYISRPEREALEAKIVEYKKIFEALVLDIKSKKILSPEELDTYDEKLKDTGRLILTVGDKVIQESIELSRRVERQTFLLLLYISVFGITFSLFLGYITTRIVRRSMKEIEDLTHELEASSMELALGLSEHFEVLRRVAQGDLTVSAPEESENELLAKLGAVINQTIGNLIESARGEVEQVYTLAASGIRVIDEEFNIIRTNQAMEELSGVSKEEALSIKCYQQLKGPICHTDECILKQILGGKEKVEIEVEGESLDGRRIPCLVKAMPFRDTEGNITGVIEDIRDITYLKEIERELEESSMELALGLSEHFEALRQVAEGNLTITTSEESKNELLAKLGTVINKTSRSLKKTMEELERAKTGLEEQVKERTKELEEAKASLEQRVKNRTIELEKSQRELQRRFKELEDFSKVAVGRELKMIKLEEEIERLEAQIEAQIKDKPKKD